MKKGRWTKLSKARAEARAEKRALEAKSRTMATIETAITQIDTGMYKEYGELSSMLNAAMSDARKEIDEIGGDVLQLLRKADRANAGVGQAMDRVDSLLRQAWEVAERAIKQQK